MYLQPDARSPGGRAVMGSHKLMSAKEHSLELQLLAKRQAMLLSSLYIYIYI